MGYSASQRGPKRLKRNILICFSIGRTLANFTSAMSDVNQVLSP